MTGQPVVLQFMGSQRVGHNLVTEQKQQNNNYWMLFMFKIITPVGKERQQIIYEVYSHDGESLKV